MAQWSDAMLTTLRRRGPLVINSIVFAEVSAGFDALEDVEAALARHYVRVEPLPGKRRFGGRAFVQSAGVANAVGPLPDFTSGAHAAVAGITLLTRERAIPFYFPKLRVSALSCHRPGAATPTAAPPAG